jgi:Homeodomain-like domain
MIAHDRRTTRRAPARHVRYNHHNHPITSITAIPTIYIDPTVVLTCKGQYEPLTREDRARILHLLCEGASIRATSRLTGASKNTIIKLLCDAGIACAAYQDRVDPERRAQAGAGR